LQLSVIIRFSEFPEVCVRRRATDPDILEGEGGESSSDESDNSSESEDKGEEKGGGGHKGRGDETVKPGKTGKRRLRPPTRRPYARILGNLVT
jgi:hypothetical protein